MFPSQTRSPSCSEGGERKRRAGIHFFMKRARNPSFPRKNVTPRRRSFAKNAHPPARLTSATNYATLT